MKPVVRALLVAIVAVSLMWVVAHARELGAREARQAIAQALGVDKPDRVHVKNISTGMGGEAVVEATVDAAFRLSQDKAGNWRAVEVRTADRRWESIELIESAVRKEKILRTTADLRTLSTALESFKRERGFYVAADTGAALLDNLSPRYVTAVLRLDAWSNEFQYKGGVGGYRLSSAGPDGKPGTADDIVIENGQPVNGDRGAARAKGAE